MREDADMTAATSAGIAAYKRNGFAVVDIFDPAEVARIEAFALAWVQALLGLSGGDTTTNPIGTYHAWAACLPPEHRGALRATNRHTCPPAELARDLLNPRLMDFLSALEPGPWRLWDEGLGWLGFRLVRPGCSDGYPLSCKAWGPAKQVVSVWVPVTGRQAPATLALVPGSHQQNFQKYLPTDGKFAANEYRLAEPAEGLILHRPDLRPTEALFFHPRVLHTEDVSEGDITRLSLEFRFLPPSAV